MKIYKIIKYGVVPLIVILIFGYIAYANIRPLGATITKTIDVGTDDRLNPVKRVSQNQVYDTGETYKELTDSLVYFEVPTISRTDKVDIKVRFKDNFPESSVFRIGARDKQEWHYLTKPTYYTSENLNKITYNLENYPKNLPRDSIIGTNINDFVMVNNELWLAEETHENLTINHAIRGSHTIYIYAKGRLEITFYKKDLNWYENSDEINVSLYKDTLLLKTITIEDDGITDASKKVTTEIKKTLSTDNLNGVYRIEILSNADSIITKIESNQNKLVFYEHLFLADNSLYGVDNKSSQIYTVNYKDSPIRFQTYHRQGLQIVKTVNHTFDINQIQTWLDFDLTPGQTLITSYNNDIIIEGPFYFAFSKESYFRPYRYKITRNFDFADYLILDYTKPVQDGDWIIGEASFNTASLVPINNKYSFLLNAPHLSNNQSKNMTIPVDWIEVTYHIPPLI